MTNFPRQFLCPFCHRGFSWETDAYAYVHSQILLHLAGCEEAGALSRNEIRMAALAAADQVLGHRGRSGARH